MSEQAETTEWSWQWTATLGVVLGYGLSAMLWIRGFQVIAPVITIAATILGMSVIASR